MPASDEYIDAFFGIDGYLSRIKRHYVPREPQIRSAHEINRACFSQTSLMVEGPPGTGKSFAYGVPASYHASLYKKRVLIVTAHIALQQQLVDLDLRTIRELVPWPFTYSVLKGRENYLCKDRHDQYQDATPVRSASSRAAEGQDLTQLGRHPSVVRSPQRYCTACTASTDMMGVQCFSQPNRALGS